MAWRQFALFNCKISTLISDFSPHHFGWNILGKKHLKVGNCHIYLSETASGTRTNVGQGLILCMMN